MVLRKVKKHSILVISGPRWARGSSPSSTSSALQQPSRRGWKAYWMLGEQSIVCNICDPHCYPYKNQEFSFMNFNIATGRSFLHLYLSHQFSGSACSFMHRALFSRTAHWQLLSPESTIGNLSVCLIANSSASFHWNNPCRSFSPQKAYCAVPATSREFQHRNDAKSSKYHHYFPLQVSALRVGTIYQLYPHVKTLEVRHPSQCAMQSGRGFCALRWAHTDKLRVMFQQNSRGIYRLQQLPTLSPYHQLRLELERNLLSIDKHQWHSSPHTSTLLLDEYFDLNVTDSEPEDVGSDAPGVVPGVPSNVNTRASTPATGKSDNQANNEDNIEAKDIHHFFRRTDKDQTCVHCEKHHNANPAAWNPKVKFVYSRCTGNKGLRIHIKNNHKREYLKVSNLVPPVLSGELRTRRTYIGAIFILRSQAVLPDVGGYSNRKPVQGNNKKDIGGMVPEGGVGPELGGAM
ncbi:hypothetical protein BV22DRAFT_1051773 [Leucogyrophana mollusca]|uniref:Uncharacterized protein n=1 Tax=Leucogyrophana mollusca TaxID=85980 RepID=A0ACB8B105_9AGAM|nr:hypothetical protein BV22DRAFT_1051773 [Leucogyrophana mollusca]